MDVRSASRSAQASHRGGFETLSVWQAMPPLLPQTGFSQSQLAVFLDSLVAFELDRLQQQFSRLGQARRSFLDHPGQPIQIMHVSQQVLYSLQVFGPGGVMLGQQAFDSVA